MSSQSGSSSSTSALLSFTARNVHSYREEVNLSLLGTRLSEPDAVRKLTLAGSSAPVSVLPAAGIFGANASGKSTILRAMADMRAIVLGSFRGGDRNTTIRRHPFLLDDRSNEQPSCFAIDLVLGGVRWQYGFEIDDHHVLDEYAYYYPKGRQALVFRRKRDVPEPGFGAFFLSPGRALARLLRKNALLLSVAGAATDDRIDDARPGITLLGSLFAWFRANLLLMQSGNREKRIVHTAERARSDATRPAVLALLEAADLGITEIEKVPVDPETVNRIQRALRILQGLEDEPRAGRDDDLAIRDFVRLVHAGAQGSISIDPERESQGTLTWVSLLGPVLDALKTGSAVLVDELDASLHPHLVRRVVQLFQNRNNNPRCAQLIFNAHDPTILGDSEQRAIGRDQIWLTEKDPDGATRIYSLAEFRPKRDEALERRYLQGRYGGVPVLDPAAFRQATKP